MSLVCPVPRYPEGEYYDGADQMKTFQTMSELAQISAGPEIRKTGQPHTLDEYIVELVQANRTGIFTEIGFDGAERSRTYGALFDDAKKLAAILRTSHVHVGEFVILCFDSAIEYVSAAWACLLNGFSFFPLSTFQFSRDRDESINRIRWLTETLGASLILTEGRFCEFASNAVSVDAGIAILDTTQLLLSQESCDDLARSPSPSDILIETSGTTGRAKLACLGGDKIINRLFDGASADQRVSLNLLAHTSVGGLRLLLPIGRRTVFLSPYRMMANPAAWLDCVSRFAVTDAGMSCSMAAKINEIVLSRKGDWSVASLERLAFGSETITPSIIRSLITNLEALGMENPTAFLVYSMTETGPLFSSRLPIRDLLDAAAISHGRFKLNRCTDSWSVRVVGEAGDIAAKGEIGRIHVRSDSRLFRTYLPSDVSPLTEDGWFDTGDLGSLDDQGLLITGRDKSTIAINARKISSEDVEMCLSEIDGLSPGLVFAAPVRGVDSATDELAVFFVPQSRDETHLSLLVARMQSAVTKQLGVRITHLVPVDEDNIERTTTGKVRRHALAEGFRSGRWTIKKPAFSVEDDGENLVWLKDQWKQILKLDFVPASDQNFFDLGGDSLACAELLFAVEEHCNRRLSLDKFFEDPTPARMAELISVASGTASPERDSGDGRAVLRKLHSFSASWRGSRLFGESMLVGFNTDGSRLPVFWILHNHAKAAFFAKHLGPDQPFYAMRSCVDVVEEKHFTAELLDTVCDRYLWEMLALPVGSGFVLGGTCQGGIFALAMARRLKQIRRPPLLLALLEWNFSYGSYPEPTLLIYGKNSHTAGIYEKPEKSSIKWREEFPNSVVAAVPGRHEDLEQRNDSITRLVMLLNRNTDRVLNTLSTDWHQNELAAKLAHSQAETAKLRAKLRSRTRQVRKLRSSWRIRAPLRAILSSLIKDAR